MRTAGRSFSCPRSSTSFLPLAMLHAWAFGLYLTYRPNRVQVLNRLLYVFVPTWGVPRGLNVGQQELQGGPPECMYRQSTRKGDKCLLDAGC
ncbi:unnamed protein product [Ixodes pacificus]